MILLFLLGPATAAYSQGKLYTARGYWEESRNSMYQSIQKKVDKGDSLTENEKNYFQDYQAFLNTYFQRLPSDEKVDYERLKELWDKGQAVEIERREESKSFEWRGRDRLSNAFYGLYYGTSIAIIGEMNGPAAVGVPLITGGLWMLGPVINPAKYASITRNTIRASSTGKLLGLGYGYALGAALAGNSTDNKLSLGLSSAGSIILGELAFYAQEKHNYSRGHIEIMRHYGFLGPWIGFATTATIHDKNASGAAILAGGIAGLVIGNSAANKYNYTAGDVDAISSLTLITTGIGFATVSETLNGTGDNLSLFMIPAATSIAGTLWAQQSIRGAQLTDKQGSTINLSTAGTALVGVGIVSLMQPKSGAVWLAVPSGLALITHQLLLHKYKTENLQLKLQGSNPKKGRYNVALKLTPESYFLNKQIPVKEYSPQTVSRINNPVFKLTITF